MKGKYLEFQIVLWFGLALLAWSTNVFPQTYFVAQLGTARADLDNPGADAAWTQPSQGYDYQLNFASPAWSLGVGYRFDRTALELRYNELGKFSTFAAWGCSDDRTFCGETVYGYGAASARSVSLSVIPSIGVGPVDLLLEVGAHYWRSEWLTLYSNPLDDFAHSYLRWEPVKAEGTMGLGGAGVRYDNVRLMWHYYHILPRDGAYKSVQTVTVGYEF